MREKSMSPAKLFGQTFLKFDAKQFAQHFLSKERTCAKKENMPLKEKTMWFESTRGLKQRKLGFFSKSFFLKEKFWIKKI